MSANALLLWMSARRHGSWQQFRAAAEALHLTGDDGLEADDEASDQFALPLYQMLRLNLQRLGHAEFFAGAGKDADWRVTPPTLATTAHRHGWIGILLGARSQTLLTRMRAFTESLNFQLLQFPAYPDQIVFAATDLNSLAAIARHSNLHLQNDAPTALLASLPPIDDPCVCHSTDLPFGAEWKIDRFCPDDITWRAATFAEAAATSGGLFRLSLRHQRQMLFYRRGKAFRIPGQVGKYLVLRKKRHQVLQYDSRNHTLSIPASFRPPFLIERALILCSGSPPTYERGSRTGILRYSEVSENIATSAAELLRQEIR